MSDDFNVWDDVFNTHDIDGDGDADMKDAMLRDDMDVYTESAVYGTVKRNLKILTAAMTNENITITNLSFAEGVNLQSNGGSIICDNLGAGKEITLAVKNGDITGSISGTMDEFSITCTIKKGESNLPALKEGGDKSLTAECNNGDINIEFAK